ncbi:small-conductance mechanosensitive channel [Rivularia sp. PCC 7116]|uniref:mechanosensitive ion channel family protein n=1 Tax=Rivularia sp. PCC 7116 TaxID=373994 RepID=UPI00029EEDC8|nr:mechanosensitive ion channel domain-containing protein [Rivularia sp. PCC 7116]AFY52703.1 small-conductance mechanosensitive channel [Rivularia sp. PCC 7116]
MIELLSNNILFSPKIQLTFFIGVLSSVAFFIGCIFPRIAKFSLSLFVSSEAGEKIANLLQPYRHLIGIAFGLGFLDIVALFIPVLDDYPVIEKIISFILTIEACWLVIRIFGKYIDDYILESALKSGRKANSELLNLGKYTAYLAIIFAGIIFFAVTHNINILSLLASLGIGGVAVAFASKTTIEQLLSGVVLYVDHPFFIDDYIGLPDGTFGRVESIGWRSTKIRTSGKGTVIVIPNNSLTQMNIENFSGAKKVISILYLNFNRKVEPKEQALIEQVVLTGTKDIFGLDSRSTRIDFRTTNQESQLKTQAQVSLFILDSGKVSMELRRQLLDMATETINQKLKGYGIDFEIEEPTIYVDAPVTI